MVRDEVRVDVHLVRQRAHQVGQRELLVGIDERLDAGRVDQEAVEGVVRLDVGVNIAEPAVADVRARFGGQLPELDELLSRQLADNQLGRTELDGELRVVRIVRGRRVERGDDVASLRVTADELLPTSLVSA